jgi:hypothetical protein
MVKIPHLQALRDAVKHPTTFVHDARGYRTVRNDFTALVSLEPLSAGVLLLFEEDPKLLRSIALYDLGTAIKNPLASSKINQTTSEVFTEFEKFLIKDFGVQLTDFRVFSDHENQLQILDSVTNPVEASITKKALPRRRLRIHLPFPWHRMPNDFNEEIDQDEIFEKGEVNYWPENSCCNCMATMFARVRSVLT